MDRTLTLISAISETIRDNKKFIYTAAHIYPYGGFEYFVKSGFDREPLKLHKQMIPHFSLYKIDIF